LEKDSKKNPQKDDDQIKKDLHSLRIKLGKKRKAIESGELVFLLEDECHFCWGDVEGYVWSEQGKRAEVPIENERKRQTYFGYTNIATGRARVKKYPKGDGENAVKFLKYVVKQFPKQQILLLWDKATYHTGNLVKAYLSELNDGLSKKDWILTLELLPTAAPEENPIETIWLKGKNHVRSQFEKCDVFSDVKTIFEEYVNEQVFKFDKMNNFGCFFS